MRQRQVYPQAIESVLITVNLIQIANKNIFQLYINNNVKIIFVHLLIQFPVDKCPPAVLLQKLTLLTEISIVFPY